MIEVTHHQRTETAGKQEWFNEDVYKQLAEKFPALTLDQIRQVVEEHRAVIEKATLTLFIPVIIEGALAVEQKKTKIIRR